MMDLNVNIDHVATIRNARGGTEPEPVTAAVQAELAGVNGIVCHLREDRRHINDRDLMLLRELVTSKLDLEMAANEEIIKIALKTKPELVTIVPEKRLELTTEGGLNVAGNIDKFLKLVDRMHEQNIEVSFFIEPEEEQIDAVLKISGDMVEFHTGLYANSKNKNEHNLELNRMIEASVYAYKNKLQIAAGHGLNYLNVKPIAQIPVIQELSIGHSIISRAVFSGIKDAVREMIEIIKSSSLNNIANKI